MELKTRVDNCLGRDLLAFSEHRGDLCVEVPKSRIISVLTALRDDESLGFDFLSDLFGVDNLDLYKKAKPKKKDEDESEAPEKEEPKPRFEVVYLLLSLKSNERLQVKIRLFEDDMTVDSVTSLWRAATWPEREAYDMFGIVFKGHPGLKRLLMWDGFPAHPLRKDYPLEGQGEERVLIYQQ